MILSYVIHLKKQNIVKYSPDSNRNMFGGDIMFMIVWISESHPGLSESDNFIPHPMWRLVEFATN